MSRSEYDALGPFQRLRGAFPHIGIPALIEQEVAVPEAPDRVEQRIGRLPLLLHPLGFLELRGGFLPEAHRVQGRGQRRPADHALEGIAALVGKLDALPGLRQGLAELAAGLEKLAEVGGADGGVLPVLLSDAPLQRHPHQPRGLRQPAQRAERKARVVQDNGLVRLAEPRREPLPGGIEERREDGDLAAEGSELLSVEVLVLAPDALPPNLIERLLVLPRPAPMHHRRIERRHLLDRLGQRLRLPLQVLIQPPVPLPPRLRLLPPELLPEVLAHQRVRVEPLVLLPPPPPAAPRAAASRPPCSTPARRAPPARPSARATTGSARSAAISSSPAGRSKSPSIRRIATSGFPEPLLVSRHHPPACPPAARPPPAARSPRAAACPPLRDVRQVGPEQRQRQAVPLVFARRLPQLLVRPLRAARPEQLGACLLRQLAQVRAPAPCLPREPLQIRHRDPARDHAEPRVLRPQLLHQRLQRRILELALLAPPAPIAAAPRRPAPGGSAASSPAPPAAPPCPTATPASGPGPRTTSAPRR